VTIFDAFRRIYVINLPTRPDRRRAVLADLAQAGVAADDPRLRIFPGIRPDDAGAFPSLGARGCYLSHLGALKEALADGLDNVLILEDDLALEPLARLPQPQMAEVLAQGAWDFAYPGHMADAGGAQPPAVWRTTSQDLVCAHFYGVSRRALPALVAYLEDCMSRPPGHPDGGPMHVDGAFNMFRRRNPGLVTLLAMPSLGGQRSSRSDIYPNRWFDRLPLVREAAGLARAAANRLRSLRTCSAGLRNS
jgi:hypothetical protein